MNKPIATLPLHLALSLANFMTCDSVFRLANDASAPLKQPLPPNPNPKKPAKLSPLKSPPKKAHLPEAVLEHLERLQQNLSPAAAPKPSNAHRPNPQENAAYLNLLQDKALLDAIHEEARRRSYVMLEGLNAYQDLEMEIEETPHEVVWEQGSARLIDYGEDDGPVVLCIPSLINRYYILDLYPGHSLVEHLLAQGFRPLVLDWGEPTAREARYDCADYIRHIAAPALHFARTEYDRPVHLMGYCMGGVFATALAVLDPEAVQSLSLLATPWDFSVQGEGVCALDEEARQHYADQIAAQETLSPTWIQALFHLMNPWHFQDKFGRFTQMSEAEKRHFAAVEAWVNDGVPLARKVATECLVEWPLHHTLRDGKWRVGSEFITPHDVACPAFIAIPTEDRIVPPASAKPLAEALPDATIIRPKTGHVSMVVGNHAAQNLWQPWTKWLKRQC